MSAPHAGARRLGSVDLFKLVASQLIVWHHLAFYGPMSDVAMAWAPATIEALARHGRLAVQVFLVLGGFLSARQLAPRARWGADTPVLRLLLDRYLRLVLPYAVALAFCIACAAFARHWFDHASLPETADATALVAHLLLAQDLMGVEALSAGIWYVAIDFQCFVLLVLLLQAAAWAERRFARGRALAPWLVVGAIAASLFVFNRDPIWDVTAPYFFAAYGFGVLAAWQTAPRAWAARRVPLWPAVALLCLLLALLIDPRVRIAFAAAVALALVLLLRRGWQPPRGARRLVEGASRISYALFLVHFGVCLVVNALFTALLPLTPAVQSLGLLVAWAASVMAAWVLHERVERPWLRWLAQRPAPLGMAVGVR